MAFVNLSLLAGGLLAAIPIILHLVLRQQPKRVTFPAVRFLKERRETNRRQLQLRHWLLLLLRCSVIGVLSLALARPSAVSALMGRWLTVGLLAFVVLAVGILAAVAAVQRKGKWLVRGLAGLALVLFLGLAGLAGTTLAGSPRILGDEQAPVAAVLVFDTSPRMAYRYQNQTRLDLARETALWLLQQFPPDSQTAVVESRPGPPFFSVDLAAARNSIERMRTTGTPEPLGQTVARALELVRSSDKSRQEVYVFSDMTAAAWTTEQAQAIRAALSPHPGVLCYLIDVGVDEPRNASLGVLELSAQTLVARSTLTVTTDVRSQRAAGEHVVELLIETPDPALPLVVDGKPRLPPAQVRDRQTVTLTEEDSRRIAFDVRGWEPGTYQGMVRLVYEDGLPDDNVRYFAVDVREAWPVLLVAPANVSPFLLSEALAPFEQRETGTARFECREVPQSELASQELANFAIVCLLDPQPLPAPQWEQLARYVERGGSLAVFLGHNAQPATAFHESAPRRVLGGKLNRPWRAAGREVYLNPRGLDHPMLARFRGQESSVPWSDSPVFRHWSLDEWAPTVSRVIDFSNSQPAIVEQPLGAGRVMVMTTPIAEESHPAGRPAWNELLTSENAWPSFVLVNEWMQYLASGRENRLNYVTGETATLANDAVRDPPRYQLFTPLDEPQDAVARDGVIVVPFTEHPGAYRLKGQRNGPHLRGFAVNLPSESSDLTRVPRERLNEWLGKDAFRYARSRDEIVLEVGEARVGREFYPYLLLVLVVVLGLEHTLANRFYPRPEAAPGSVG